ncbi:hypothetical protein [Paracidovorax cattleyae]|uniref:hypothetical protein n=1 Tax=Paracidovorax cattleyae TaxID=80868 RepID=UPI0018AF98EF|nr:hypothetical protein [Paracidovorax cattleyae]MBF9263381.1 hypothetical protein [Paracidovorax cattleyae]
MTQSISFELRKTSGGSTYAAVVLEHSIDQHTRIRVETNVPNSFGNDSLNQIQARLWEGTATQIADLVKTLRRSIPAVSPSPESNPGS